MLMITRSDAKRSARTLKLEGKLLGPWIGELESACRDVLRTAEQRSPRPPRPDFRRRGGGSVSRV